MRRNRDCTLVGSMLFSQELVSLDEFEMRSSWHLRPEGLPS